MFLMSPTIRKTIREAKATKKTTVTGLFTASRKIRVVFILIYRFNVDIYRFSICKGITILENGQIKTIKNYRITINLAFVKNFIAIQWAEILFAV